MVVVGGFLVIFFLKIGTIALEGESELPDNFFHIGSVGLTFLVGLSQQSL